MRVDDTHPDVIEMMSAATKAVRSKAERASERERLAEWYEEGMRARARRKWQDAIVAFEKIEASDPDFRDVKAKLLQVRIRESPDRWG